MTTISIRFAEDGDRADWDAYVEASNISPYCRYSWKKAVAEAYGHHGYYLMAEKNNTLVGIFPFIHMKIPLGLSSLVSLPFCDTGGLHAFDEMAATLLLREAFQLRSQLKVHNLLIRNMNESFSNVPLNGLEHMLERSKVSMRLALPDSVDELWGSFKSKLRSQVAKAEKNGLAFCWGSENEFNDFYAMFSRNMRDLGSPVHSKKWFEAVIAQYGGHVKLGLVYMGKTIIGGGILLCNSNRFCIPWASTLRQYNNLNPNMLLYWSFLKFSVENKCREFDFGRSTPGEGTYKFKKQWGAVEHPLFWHSFIKMSRKYAPDGKSQSGRAKLVAAWKRLPLPLANLIGPILRKYINL